MTATFTNATQTMAIVTNDTITSSSLYFEVNSNDVLFNRDIQYEHTKQVTYSIESDVNPAVDLNFAEVQPIHVSRSSIQFSEPRAGVPTGLLVKVHPVEDVFISDILAIHLFDFTLSAEFTADTEYNFTGGLGQHVPFSVEHSRFVYETAVSAVVLQLNVSEHIHANEPIEFIISPENGISIPSTGIVGTESLRDPLLVTFGVTASPSPYLTLNRPGDNGVVFRGPVEVVQSVGAVTAASVVFDTPKVNTVTAMTVTWQLENIIFANDLVVFSMPGLTRPPELIGDVVITGDASCCFSARWNNVTNELIFTAIAGTLSPSDTIRLWTANMAVLERFTLPPAGVGSTTDTHGITIHALTRAPVLSTPVSDVTVVPFVTQSALSFISTLAKDEIETEMNPYFLQLRPGHSFSEVDVGAKVYINGDLYTIIAIADDIIQLREPYTGPVIQYEQPYSEVLTSPIRPAYYHSGSATELLTFRYLIQRGDHMESIVIATTNITDFIAESLDLNEGQLLRTSLNPVIEATRSLGKAAFHGESWNINTNAPRILNFTTTSRAGVYAENDQVEFTIHFTYPVVLKPDAGNVADPLKPNAFFEPRGNVTAWLLLHNVQPSEIVAAEYDSGTTTKILTFVYTVSRLDRQVHLRSDLITRNFGVVQPLRVIIDNRISYLRRYSPSGLYLVGAELLFGANIGQYSPANIGMVGDAPRVERTYVNLKNAFGETFTVGDVLQVFVEFNSGVTVVLGSGTGVPTLELDVGRPVDPATGRTVPGVGSYTGMLDDQTMIFEYNVSPLDSLSGGLYLFCGCEDYFKRTFIDLSPTAVGSGIIQTANTTIHASLVLARSPLPEHLLIDPEFVITNVPPVVIEMGLNVSSDEVYSVGAAVAVRVKFNARVAVVGLVHLGLGGDNTTCYARYFEGNETDTLHFLYVTSHVSGAAVLDCVGIDSIRYTQVFAGGTNNNGMPSGIYRLSDQPSLLVDKLVFRPGTFNSLGVRTGILHRDVNEDVNVEDKDAMVTSLDSFSLSGIDHSLHHIIEEYLGESEELRFNLKGNSLANLTSLLESRMAEDNLIIDATHLDSTDSLQTVFVTNAKQLPFKFLPDILTSSSTDAVKKQWWRNYVVQSYIDILVHYDHDVVADDVAIVLQTVEQVSRPLALPAGHALTTTTSFNPACQP